MGSVQSEPFGFSLGSPSPLGDSLSSLDRDCPVGSGRSLAVRSQNQTSSRSLVSPPAQQTSRYKTEMCRPFQENGTCKYGEKCQFAHGTVEVRNINRHPKYKTDLCRTYHSVGFCLTDLAATLSMPSMRYETAPSRHPRKSSSQQTDHQELRNYHVHGQADEHLF